MTPPSPRLHLPRPTDPRRLAPSPYGSAEDLRHVVRLPAGDAGTAPPPPARGLAEADSKLHRGASLLRPPSRLSGMRLEDDVEMQRCSVLVDPHCGNPTGLLAALLSVNDPLKLPRWLARRSRQVPVLLAPAAARITRRCSSVKHTLRAVPSIWWPPHECVVCQTGIRGRGVRLRCGHRYHAGCLLQLVEAATRDEALFPPRCCGAPIGERVFARRMAPALARTYRERAAEFATVRRVYCAAPACSRFLGARTTAGAGAGAYVCAACATRTCSGCGLPVRVRGGGGAQHVCGADGAQRAVLALAARQGWRRCPGCEQLIERHSGCFHMTCVCGTQFCYVCGCAWKTCGCPRWEQVELRALDAPPPLADARPPTPPPKPARAHSDPRPVSPLRRESRDGPQTSVDARGASGPPEVGHSAARALRRSAYATDGGGWAGDASGLQGVDGRVLEGGLRAQRRRGICMPRARCG